MIVRSSPNAKKTESHAKAAKVAKEIERSTAEKIPLYVRCCGCGQPRSDTVFIDSGTGDG